MDVKYSVLAEADLQEIADYLVDVAGADTAYKVTDEIERVIYSVISLNLDLGKLATTATGDVRFFPAGKYAVYGIYYEVENDTLTVYRVPHGKRNVKSILDLN